MSCEENITAPSDNDETDMNWTSKCSASKAARQCRVWLKNLHHGRHERALRHGPAYPSVAMPVGSDVSSRHACGGPSSDIHSHGICSDQLVRSRIVAAQRWPF